MIEHPRSRWVETSEDSNVIFTIQLRDRPERAVVLVCPRCGLDRTGVVVTPVRWVQLGSWPIVPLGDCDQRVRCNTCGRRSDLGALDVPTSTQLTAILEDAWVAALVLAVRAGGESAATRGLEQAGAALAEAGFDATAAGLGSAIDSLSTADAHRRLRRLAPEMTTFGKQGFLHRVTTAGAIDGELSDGQAVALDEIGRSLGMDDSHVHAVLAVAMQDSTA